MPPSTFARHCCELLASAGPCEIRPMFGAWGISTGGYSAPQDAMDSPQLMAPWARQALECALKAQASKEGRRPSLAQPRPARAASSRPAALAPSTTAKRKSGPAEQGPRPAVALAAAPS